MIFLNILIFIASFMMMEFVAWVTHKYVMHGFLWVLHRDHHQKNHETFFERNDAFFLIFAVPGIALIYFGYPNGIEDPRLWMGVAIALYGLSYMLVHDIFVHQRLKMFKRTNNVYLRALRKAHKIHHKHLGKADGECFGILWVPRKYLIEAKQAVVKQYH